MKLNKYIVTLLFVSIQIVSYGQKKDIFLNEFMLSDDFNDVVYSKSGTTNTCCNNAENLDFNWSNGWSINTFGTAFSNAAAIEQAKLDGVNQWYENQFNIIKDLINNKYGTKHSNIEEAKNDIFLRTEENNIFKNSISLKNEYSKLLSDGSNKKSLNIKNLALLQIRKNEILSGNINNPVYPYININGVALKDIKDVNLLNELWNNQIKAFGANHYNNHNNYLIYNKLLTISNDSDYKKELLRLKNGYYNSFGKWDKLNLMQVFLNYEEFKKYTQLPYVFPQHLSQFAAFQKLDQATAENIRNYTINNRGGTRTVFDPYYDMYGPFYNIWYAREDRQEALERVGEILEQRQNTINEALNNVKTWFLDADNDGYHAKGSSPKVQSQSPGNGWREGVSKDEDCDDANKHKNVIYSNVCVDECELAKAAKNIYNTNGTIKQDAYTNSIDVKGDFGDGWVLAKIDNLNLGNDFQFSNNISGFDSALYFKEVSGHKEYLYVTRGTDVTSFNDWAANLIQGVPQIAITASQYEQSVANAIKIHNSIGVNDVLFFAGHSLGGGLATANSLATGDIAFTYNAAGLGISTLISIVGINGRRLIENLRENEHLINATINSEEILNYYFTKIGLGAQGNKTFLDGILATRVRDFDNLSEEQFKKANEAANDFKLKEAYGFLKNGLSNKYKANKFRLDLHEMDQVLKLLGCN